MTLLTDIAQLIARHALPDSAVEPLDGLRLIHATAPTAPSHTLCAPTFALVAQGSKRTVLGHQIFNYVAGEYLVASVDLPISGHVVQASAQAPYLAMTVTLDPAAIASLLLEDADPPMDMRGPGIGVSVASQDLLEVVRRLLRLVEQRQDIPVLAPMFRRELLWRLLAGEHGAMVREIGLADSRLARISRAIAWIRDHYAQGLEGETLAEAAGMSPSSFYRHFRSITGMSPLQFQKQIRLQDARARLLGGAPDVASVGFAVGYDSPSQFSREYARLFGAPPGLDAKRRRETGGLEPGLP
ncbi:AraC family transcriptional regulator [Xanthomonas hyacinthi]|uniref:AraC family transcriptional regulator n=2 Tax=Xanthomonas hyacinthi TaxID=56455 RepID=A0A2S7EYN6_9XANT|nr:AraC family transcriptional regulator [Xanthomonas hyacinthi]PPU98256.1 AraC family transcriptional regulator [Xanthomonas hyacinthi]QGY76828.1 AraC family transcriptional regulator [Xanthomonas hyacinthi]